MKYFIGLGSNLGDRKVQFEKAASAFRSNPDVKLGMASPIVENPALIPPGAPGTWQRPFLNAVIQIDWRGSSEELLRFLKAVEADQGRVPSERWAPRPIDLDILCSEELSKTPDLRIPHPEMCGRQFVLSPLKHLSGGLRVGDKTVLQQSRSMPLPLPLWMGIMNLAPNSFSDGGQLTTQLDSGAELAARIAAMDAENIQILDIGGESTRPGAEPITSETEWERLMPALKIMQSHFSQRVFRPLISVDTYRPETAARALGLGADMINDVSGLRQPEMLGILRESDCQYVLMHSLSVPANAEKVLTSQDPVEEIKRWAQEKLQVLQAAGICLDRVLFDPGIGFGKTAAQSLAILRRIREFMDLPVRILIGHSRKSFLGFLRERAAADRDAETLGVSFWLADSGVDVLRVHAPELSARAFQSFREMQ